ncbi:MAG: nuclear transport factor 2 family protein [Cyclobacteriaceae bacterium]
MKRLLFALLILVAAPAFSQTDTTAIHTFIDDWHLAATKADANAYFGMIADKGIFIGTDATERWNKQQFLAFAKPYFDRGKAWDFKAYGRSVHVSNDGRFVWFSELLTTWMGVCRGSGILEKTPKGWQIQQYHLSVTVPNDLVRDFITLVANFEKGKK